MLATRRRALNYITLTAARFQLIRLIVLPVDLRDKCIGMGQASHTPPVPIAVKTVPYVIWSDSTLAARLNKTAGVKKSPKATKVPDYLKTVKVHNILASETCCGGKLGHMLMWVEGLLATHRRMDCLFVGVWSFSDFFKGNDNVMCHLPDAFFAKLNRLIVSHHPVP